MSAKIIKLVPDAVGEGYEIAPDTVLENNKGKLQCVVLVGYTKDGELVCASSENVNKALWLVEKAKKEILI